MDIVEMLFEVSTLGNVVDALRIDECDRDRLVAEYGIGNNQFDAFRQHEFAMAAVVYALEQVLQPFERCFPGFAGMPHVAAVSLV